LFIAPKGATTSPAADGGNNRNLRPGRQNCGESTGVSDVLVSDEHVDVFPNLSLFSHNAVSNARAKNPQGLQAIAKRGWGGINFDPAVSTGKRTQGTRYVECDGH
jgi:hypothetical protein